MVYPSLYNIQFVYSFAVFTTQEANSYLKLSTKKLAHLVFTCSKSSMKTPEQCVKFVQMKTL